MANITAEHIQKHAATVRLRDRYKFRLALRRALRSVSFERFLTQLLVLFAVVLTALSYLEPHLGSDSSIVRASITAFRVIRVLRTLRLVTNVPSMKVVIESFLRSIPGILSVVMVLLLMVFVFALIGQNLYSSEGWPDVSREVMDKVPSAWVYFVCFIAINSFTVLNLMIAVIIGAMQKEYSDEAEEEREDILLEIQALRRDIAQLHHKKTADG